MKNNLFLNDQDITLENISSKKAEIAQQLLQQKKQINKLSHQLFTPMPSATSKMDSLMRTFNSGLAAYDGVMTGLKIIRRIKSTFRKK